MIGRREFASRAGRGAGGGNILFLDTFQRNGNLDANPTPDIGPDWREISNGSQGIFAYLITTDGDQTAEDIYDIDGNLLTLDGFVTNAQNNSTLFLSQFGNVGNDTTEPWYMKSRSGIVTGNRGSSPAMRYEPYYGASNDYVRVIIKQSYGNVTFQLFYKSTVEASGSINLPFDTSKTYLFDVEMNHYGGGDFELLFGGVSHYRGVLTNANFVSNAGFRIGFDTINSSSLSDMVLTDWVEYGTP